MNKIFLIFLFLSFWMTSCISQLPQYTAIQDGVRCPLPKQLASSDISSKPNQPKRAPASESEKTSEHICDQLFSQ